MVLYAMSNQDEREINRQEIVLDQIKSISATLHDGFPKTPRPKVGEIIGEPFYIPDSAFAPLTEEELKEWGL